MCEINPKRSEFFKLEFFTSQDITDSEWTNLVLERILKLEQEFNASGKIRVHVHPIQQSIAGSVRSKRKAKASRENGKLGGRPRGTKNARP